VTFLTCQQQIGWSSDLWTILAVGELWLWCVVIASSM